MEILNTCISRHFSYLSWKVGNGTQVRVRVDAIMGCDRRIFIPADLILHFHFVGKSTLNKLVSPTTTSIWSQGWMLVDDLHLLANWVVDWHNYVDALRKAHIKLGHVEDEIFWGHNVARGTYTSKLGYEALFNVAGSQGIFVVEENLEGFFSTKNQTNDVVGSKHQGVNMGDAKKSHKAGPSICLLCCGEEETIHLFYFL
jgi:hypothetical protein